MFFPKLANKILFKGLVLFIKLCVVVDGIALVNGLRKALKIIAVTGTKTAG